MTGRKPMDDVLIVVPGITGTELKRDGNIVWGLGAGPLVRGLTSLGASLAPLRVLDPTADDGVEPGDVILGLHALPGVWVPAAGYGGLLDHLQRTYTVELGKIDVDPPTNLLAFGYDWRLSNRHSSAELATFVAQALDRWRAAGHPDAKVVLICHSMGGLVARHSLTCPGVSAMVRRVVTIGTPYRGAAKALTWLGNGLGWRFGPNAALLTDVARSFPSLYELLPRYDSVAGPDGAAGLRHHGELSHPGLDTKLLSAADDFHRDLWPGREPDDLRVLYGMDQPTATTAEVVGDRLVPLTTIRDVEEGGDGTVPRLASRPPRWDDLDPRRGGHVEHHGSLPSHPGVHGKLQELFTGSATTHRGPTGEVSLGVDVPDLAQAGEQVEVEVTAPPGADRLGVVVEVRGEHDRLLRRARAINLGGGRYRSTVAALPPGIHRVCATAEGAARVTALLVVVSP